MPYKKVYGIDDLGNKVPVATYFVPPNINYLESFPYNLQTHYDSSSDSYIIDSCTFKLYYDDGTYEILDAYLANPNDESAGSDFYEYLEEYDGDIVSGNRQQVQQYIASFSGWSTSLTDGLGYTPFVLPSYGDNFTQNEGFHFNSNCAFVDGVPYYIEDGELVQIDYPLQMKVWNYTPKASFLEHPQNAGLDGTYNFENDVCEVFTVILETSSGYISDPMTISQLMDGTSEYTADMDVYNPDFEIDWDTGEIHYTSNNWMAWFGISNEYTIWQGLSPEPFVWSVTVDWDPLSTYVNGVKQVSN